MHCFPLPLPPSSRSPTPENHSAERLVSAIFSLSHARLLSAAVTVFSHLRHILPHPYSPHLEQPISSLFGASTSLRSLYHGPALHALSLSLGLLPANRYSVSRVVAFYCACHLLHDACSAVQDSTASSPFSWNILISAYLRNGYFRDAIFTYGIMLEKGISPDNFTNSAALKACGELQELGLGKQVHYYIKSFGLRCDSVVLNALLSMYAKCGAVDIARKVFDMMPERDIISWNSMILGYTSEGRWGETSELLERMWHCGFELNSVTSNTIISGHLNRKNHKEALRLISHARSRTNICSVDYVTLVLGLKACAKLKSLKNGKEIHGMAIHSNCDQLDTINNALITMYSKCYKLNYARLLFPKSFFRSMVTWNAMIAAFAVTNNIQEAAFVLQDMIASGAEPNHTTIVTLLSVCADASELQYGKQLHCYSMRHGFENYLPIENSIVDMYCKSGRVSIAHRVFNTMACYDKISFTSLIAGYASNGNMRVALKLFGEMISRGIKPDHITIEMVRLAWTRSRSRSPVPSLRFSVVGDQLLEQILVASIRSQNI